MEASIKYNRFTSLRTEPLSKNPVSLPAYERAPRSRGSVDLEEDPCRRHSNHVKANLSVHGDITIDEDVSSQLPDDGDVNAELQTEDVEPVDLKDLITEIDPPP
ncbi:hypothetical protein E4U58_004519 [Claviceps cyperi]|nr:hypothetical protein E4U58_004519 [Claviceps cyperi]